jgi:hypothetical protein
MADYFSNSKSGGRYFSTAPTKTTAASTNPEQKKNTVEVLSDIAQSMKDSGERYGTTGHRVIVRKFAIKK